MDLGLLFRPISEAVAGRGSGRLPFFWLGKSLLVVGRSCKKCSMSLKYELLLFLAVVLVGLLRLELLLLLLLGLDSAKRASIMDCAVGFLLLFFPPLNSRRQPTVVLVDANRDNLQHFRIMVQ